MSAHEPPRPERGRTAEERGPDASAAQLEAEAADGAPRTLLAMASPRYVLSMAEGYPVGIRQFLQFCLVLIYPAWLFALAVGIVVQLVGRFVLYPIVWVLFWPVRAIWGDKPEDQPAP